MIPPRNNITLRLDDARFMSQVVRGLGNAMIPSAEPLPLPRTS